MSRNRERVGGTKQTHADPPVQETAQGAVQESPFSFVVPTEFVELPSGGRFYPEGHVLHNETTIEIKQMTAKEEDILTSRSLLKKGIALDRVLRSLILDKRIDPDSLLIGDKNAIVVAARVSGYGNEYTTNVACPACGATQSYTFDLNDSHIATGEDGRDLGVVDNNDGTFNVALPKSNLDITFKLLTGRDEKRLIKQAESKKRSKDGEQNITLQLTTIIHQVNGDDSPELISYVAQNLPSGDSRHLRMAYRTTNPDLDLTQDFECGECGHEQEMEVPLNAEFFWPDR